MTWQFRASKTFWRAFARLSPGQQESARRVFLVFQRNPFDPSLRTHKIHRLSAVYRVTVWSVTIESDLRAVFYLDVGTVWTVDIGTHDIYR